MASDSPLFEKEANGERIIREPKALHKSPPTSCLAAAPAAAERACTTHGAKIARGREPVRAVRTMALPGAAGRNQVKPQMGPVRVLGQEGRR